MLITGVRIDMSNSTLQLAVEVGLQTKNFKELDQLSTELREAGIGVSNLTKTRHKKFKPAPKNFLTNFSPTRWQTILGDIARLEWGILCGECP